MRSDVAVYAARFQHFHEHLRKGLGLCCFSRRQILDQTGLYIHLHPVALVEVSTASPISKIGNPEFTALR